ncbi:MAG: prolipoprotein diacylglyceryl transferase [Synergistaceae bacterium]|nr:prolipoprotein diacylglyceryl transferase [Synergistaceae bacterium]
MYPTLFEIAGFRVDSYSVIWFIALSLAIIWVVHRLEKYGINEDIARKIMSVSFLFMLLGARAPEMIENWREYFAKPSLFLDFARGSLYETGAVLGAFISAFLLALLNRKKVSFLRLCEAASIPAMLSIAVGRWGCFLNGCCIGIETNHIFGVHFPFDKAELMRHPVQIYYSIFATVSVLILLSVEKFVSKRRELSKTHSILAPLSLILYSLMRLSIDFLRVVPSEWIYKILAYGLIFEFLWLAYGIKKATRN